MNHEAPEWESSRDLAQLVSFSTRPLYNIKAVEQQTGVLASTLRAWERRYNIVTPHRTESGYRLYSERDIALIHWLKTQVAQGMTISYAVALLAEELNRGLSPRRLTPSVDMTPIVAMRERLRDTLLAINESAANMILNEAFSVLPIETVCLRVLGPMLAEIGDGWFRGEVTIAQEHFATHYVRQKVMALLAATARNPAARPIVTATAPGDQHEIGILIVALFLQRAGWEVIHLGVNLPPEGLSKTLERLHPLLLAVSATHEAAAQRLPEIAAEVNKVPEPRPIFGYGGQIFNRLPALRDAVPGVFLGADAEETVTSVARLLRAKD